jgi:hypothetical protein
MRNLALCLLAALLFAACAASTGTKSPRRSNSLITAEEIAASAAKDAFEAVQLLRPDWLIPRGVASIRSPQATIPVAYLENTKLGEIENLRNIPAMNIAEIRFINSHDATTLFGTGHVGGAIMVKSK